MVAIDPELIVSRKAFERPPLEYTIVAALQVVEHAAVQYEVAAVDPGVTRRRLLGELTHAVAAEGKLAKTTDRVDSGQGRDAAAGAVELQQITDVDVRHAVSIGQQEVLIVTDVLLDPRQSAAGHR